MARVLLILPLCLLLQGQQGIHEFLSPDRLRDKPIIGNHIDSSLENILNDHPSRFLQMCLDKQEREIRGYKVVFEKQERVRGKLNKLERINVVFREKPFSVCFHWQTGAGLASKTVYVEGENEGKMYALPTVLDQPWVPKALKIPILEDVHSQRAKDTGFYTIDQFGLRLATQRTLASMRRARENGNLQVKYLGVYSVAELGDRACYKFIRTRPFDTNDENGLSELTLYIDKEYWVQAGSILKDGHGQLIAQYWFRDLQLNPEYAKDQFTTKALE